MVKAPTEVPRSSPELQPGGEGHQREGWSPEQGPVYNQVPRAFWPARRRQGGATPSFSSILGLTILSLICPHKTAGAGITAYDCDQPSQVVELDARGRCAASIPRSEIAGSQVQLTLQRRVNSVRVSGYSCKVTVSRRQYYCGMLSYITPAAIFEIQKPVRVSVETCRDMVANKAFTDDLTGQKFRLKVPGVVVQAVRESGEGGLHAGRVACRGEAVHVNGHVTSGVVTESYFQIRVAEEYFETDAQKVEAQRYHSTLQCRYLSSSKSYIWSPTPICKFWRAATTGGEMSGQQFIGSDRRIIVKMSGAKIELGNDCGGHTARRTQLSDMVAVVSNDSWERLSTIPVATAEERDLLLDVELEREYTEWHTRQMIGGPSLIGCNGAIPVEEAAPVALGNGRFGRRDGAVWYEFMCTERIVQLHPSHKCFKHIPIAGSGPQFVHPSSLTFVARSTEVPCPTLMPRKVAGVSGWWQLPAVTAVVAPPTSAVAEDTGLDLRPALFTSAEMAKWTQAIHFPQEKMAMSEVFFQGVCNSDASCPPSPKCKKFQMKKKPFFIATIKSNCHHKYML